MKDHEIVVLIDGNQSPEREFIFAANLARVLRIGTVSCISMGSKSSVSDCHVLLSGGSGEQTFSAGGSSVSVFEASCADMDSARAWAARVAVLRRSARALGVTFGGYERSMGDIPAVGGEVPFERIFLAAAGHRTNTFEVRRLRQKLVAPGSARIIFCPSRPVAYQRLMIDASDARLGELLTWGFEWSRRLSIPLYLVSAERVWGRRIMNIPFLARIFDWLGLEARINPIRCSLGTLRHELKPADLLLTSTDGVCADPIGCFGCRLSDILADTPFAVGVLPPGRALPLVLARPIEQNASGARNVLAEVVF